MTSVIVGAKRVEQLEDNLAAATLKLSAAELETWGAQQRFPG